MYRSTFALCSLITFLLTASIKCGEDSTALKSSDVPLFSKDNLVAWCIVPYDAKKRGPEERAEMLNRLGIRKLAYDWRGEHIPTFDKEIETLSAHKIELFAWWFPGAMIDVAKSTLEIFKRHNQHPQLWVAIGDPAGATQAEKVTNAAKNVRLIAEAADAVGCKVGLYNHGGWFGEPENQVAIIKELILPNIGIVYNFHHGHSQVGRFPEMFKLIQPYLLAVNIDGMSATGEKDGKMILPVGSGANELGMLKVIHESGWHGPIGILCHRTDIDAELALKGNMEGLEKLVAEHPELK